MDRIVDNTHHRRTVMDNRKSHWTMITLTSKQLLLLSVVIVASTTEAFTIARCHLRRTTTATDSIDSRSTFSTTRTTVTKLRDATTTTLGADNNSFLDDVYVMVNGMPGPMATAAAEACLRKGLRLAPVAMTGPDMEPSTISVYDPITLRSANVRLIPSSDRDEIVAAIAGLRASVSASDGNNKKNQYRLLAIDYTHPSAVNGNGQFYVQHNIPFVMGTTGGDRDQLLHDVQGHACVIAPNMGKQIVAMQAALSDLAQNFPGAFAGYTLSVVESHQKTKADTSGTAKAVIDSIKTLSADTTFTYDDITMLRTDEESMSKLNVPESGLRGHAFHTYTLTSPDQSVQFELKHNVVGRTVYAEGTADAVKFLARKLYSAASSDKEEENVNRVYTMIDVLKEGALE